MNRAVIYFGATGNAAADQMVMQAVEEYCALNEQLCDVNDTDLIEKIGEVSKKQLQQITKGMQIQLGMSK